MARPRVFRDPIHNQILFDRVDLASRFPKRAAHGDQVGWLLPNLINTKAFQRLRHIRQNGLTNLVFHGMEHSRFSHSLGVAYVAGEMYDRACRNSGDKPNPEQRLGVLTAALLHDLGHGPFSHTFEEVLDEAGVKFHHEAMTARLLLEEPHINRLLQSVDSTFPQYVVSFIDRKQRTQDHWTYRLVSSQLDADRIDYLLRDARHAGLIGHGFDVARLLDMLFAHGNRIVVDRHATEAVEAFLIMLYHMYQAIYFHRGVRGAVVLMRSLINRAVELFRNGNEWVFANTGSTSPHPLRLLVEAGGEIDINEYVRIGEYHVWQLAEEWQHQTKDPILQDLARRLIERDRFRARNFDSGAFASKLRGIQEDVASLVRQKLSFVSEEDAHKYYVVIDDPSRVSYKLYNWAKEEGDPTQADESIWLFDSDRGERPVPIENINDNNIFAALRGKKYYHRIMFPGEVYGDVVERLSKA